MPTFSGPWAAEFAEAYRSTDSTLVHEILAKGSITDQDYAAVSGVYVRCMKHKGFDIKITGPAGEASLDDAHGRDVVAAEDSCNSDMAVISGLRYQITRNPSDWTRTPS